MKFPEDVFYTPDHEWIKFGEDNTAIVGVTDFAQKELGDIVYVDIETEGQQIEQNDVFGTIEAVKTVSDLFLPVSGKVLSVLPKPSIPIPTETVGSLKSPPQTTHKKQTCFPTWSTRNWLVSFKQSK